MPINEILDQEREPPEITRRVNENIWNLFGDDDEADIPVSGVVGSYSAPMRRVEDYADKYADHWRGRSAWYWMWRLTQEVAEAIGVLIGVHDDDLDHELTQIASICVNWQRKRGAE